MNAAITDADRLLLEAEALLERGDIMGAIDVLTVANRREPRSDVERALVRARYEGCASLPPPTASPTRQAIRADPSGGTLYEIDARDLTASAVRAGFARSGCVLVRGLVSPDRVARLAAGINATYEAFDAKAAGDGTYDRDWYCPFPMPDVISPENAGDAVAPVPSAPPASRIPCAMHRRVTRTGAAIWTVESPRMLFEFFELVDDLGIGALITEFLGERPLLSANKCTLRKVPAEEITGGWHQDGAFLGRDVGAFNFWLALSRCGRDAPGIDLVPTRFDEIVETGNEGAIFKWSLSDEDVLAAADGIAVVRPEFEAGDALLFDHRLVHRTATSPTMTQERLAIESWWFAPSAFPPSQLPLVY